MASIHYRAISPVLKFFQRHPAPSATYTKIMDETNYKLLDQLISKSYTQPTILEVGCGQNTNPRHRHLTPANRERIISFDIIYSPVADLVADAHNLPFRDESFDVVLFHSEVEHMLNPFKVIHEIQRVLKPRGIVHATIPFWFPWHGGDYWRLSEEGVRNLFSDFELVHFGIGGGPLSALAWWLRHFLAMIVSMNNKDLYFLLKEVFGWLTFWIKYGDIFLQHNRFARYISSGFYCTYRKSVD